MALVEQLGDDGWYVVCAACCRTTLVFAVVLFFLFFYPFLLYIFLKSGIDKLDGVVYDASVS